MINLSEKVRLSTKDLRKFMAEHMPYLFFIGLIHAILYRDYWTGHRIISGTDFLFLEAPSVNFNVDCLKGGGFALWNPFVNFGFPWVEHYLNTSLSFTHLITSFLAGSNVDIVQRQLFFWIFLGGVGMYLSAIELGVSKVSSMIAAICFMFCGQIFLLPRENFMIYNACSFPYLMYGYLRCRNRGTVISLVSVLFMVQYLVGGYIATGVLGLYLLGVYVLIDSYSEKKLMLGIGHLLVTTTLSVLISSPKLLPMYLGMKSGPRLSGETMVSVPDPYNFLSSYDLLSLFVPVKYFYSVYIGMICMLVLVYCIVKKKLRLDALLVLAVMSGWLLITDSGGNLSLLRRISYYLPMLKLVRVEWLHWYFPSIFAILFCSRHMDGFLNEADSRTRIISVLSYLCLLSAAFFLAYDYKLHMPAYLVTVCMALFWLAAPYVVAPTGRPVLFAAVAAAAIAFEFGSLIDRVDINVPAVRRGNSIELMVSDQWSASHSFRDNNLVSKISPLSFINDRDRPSVDDAKTWPNLVSAIEAQFNQHLIIDLFNGKRFAGWFNNVQAKFEFIRMFESPELAALDNHPLYYLTGQNTGRADVSLERISCSQFSFSARTDAPATLILNQFFDKRWKAYVNGHKRDVMKENKYFMGVALGPGEHTVQFVFVDNVFVVTMCISLVTLAGVLIYTLLLRKNSVCQDGTTEYLSNAS